MPEFHRLLTRRRLVRRSAVQLLATGVVLGISLSGTLRVAVAADAQAMLIASDAVRNPGQPFRVTLTLTEFDQGTLLNSTTLLSYSRTLADSGQFASLVRYTDPPRDAGKAMLRNGSDLWFYDPSTQSTLRVAPQQRLLGQAANGDVVTVNFARDYNATLSGEETVQDGERRQRQASKLLLSPSNDDATYGSIELWVDSQTHAPIKARLFADSGRLLKTTYYRKFQRQLGADRPTELVIIDGVDPKAVTLIRLSNYLARNIPLNWFQRDHLPRFSAD